MPFHKFQIRKCFGFFFLLYFWNCFLAPKGERCNLSDFPRDKLWNCIILRGMFSLLKAILKLLMPKRLIKFQTIFTLSFLSIPAFHSFIFHCVYISTSRCHEHVIHFHLSVLSTRILKGNCHSRGWKSNKSYGKLFKIFWLADENATKKRTFTIESVGIKLELTFWFMENRKQKWWDADLVQLLIIVLCFVRWKIIRACLVFKSSLNFGSRVLWLSIVLVSKL